MCGMSIQNVSEICPLLCANTNTLFLPMHAKDLVENCNALWIFCLEQNAIYGIYKVGGKLFQENVQVALMQFFSFF